ncbi:lipocalin family protein [Burkholderia sp. S171]|uniref:lipocalin family protein n=1 Tax=Burkholderia sp. S171 TaxID=1641860 RepID=UPI00131ACB6B|nr:lipocalin family protein [Burkholderia sp. S171]
MSRYSRVVVAVLFTLLLTACMSSPPNPNPRASVEPKLASVDLPRYMGRWYIVANIPYFAEDNFVGSYAQWKLRDDGKIDDSYYAHKGSFDAPLKHYQFTDSIVPGTNNAEWSVRIFWPIYASQQTLYVDPDYQYTILGYPGKKLAWIFARSPDISDAKYHELLGRLDEMGYDTSRLRRVPQTPEQIGKPGFHSPGDKD